MVRRRRNGCAGQILTEVALILVPLMFLTGSIIQMALMGYGACLARYAAFAGLRSAAVYPEIRSRGEINEVVSECLAKAPGVYLRSVELTECAEGMPILSVTVRVPILVPLLPEALGSIQGKCTMPMEPEW